jgi:hypothetical protein
MVTTIFDEKNSCQFFGGKPGFFNYFSTPHIQRFFKVPNHFSTLSRVGKTMKTLIFHKNAPLTGF